MVWGWSKNGKFTVQSAYKAFESFGSGAHAFWNNIWHWQGPPRIRYFFWLTAHEAFLCNSKRKKLGLCEVDRCPRCRSSIESPLPILRDCMFAKVIWKQLVDPGKWDQFFSLNLQQWLLVAMVQNFSNKDVKRGDPLPPYLFVLCLERLSQRIGQLVSANSWRPMRFGRTGPKISYLFFADDMLLFAEADSLQARLIKSVLQEFCEVSSQKVSAGKTRFLFSKNIFIQQQGHLSQEFGFVRTNDFVKYLGMPLVQGRVTRNTFVEILNKVDKKLAGWKHDKLSFTGRIMLVKPVLRSIPAFAMQTVKLLVTLCDEIDKRIKSFLWGSTERRRKVHLVSWEKICQPKTEGGLGLRI